MIGSSSLLPGASITTVRLPSCGDTSCYGPEAAYHLHVLGSILGVMGSREGSKSESIRTYCKLLANHSSYPNRLSAFEIPSGSHVRVRTCHLLHHRS